MSATPWTPGDTTARVRAVLSRYNIDPEHVHPYYVVDIPWDRAPLVRDELERNGIELSTENQEELEVVIDRGTIELVTQAPALDTALLAANTLLALDEQAPLRQRLERTRLDLTLDRVTQDRLRQATAPYTFTSETHLLSWLLVSDIADQFYSTAFGHATCGDGPAAETLAVLLLDVDGHHDEPSLSWGLLVSSVQAAIENDLCSAARALTVPTVRAGRLRSLGHDRGR